MAQPVQPTVNPAAAPLSEIESVIGYRFRQRALLEEAFTHSSLKRDNPDFEGNDFQRLEFLGDAVIGFLLADLIFERYPDLREGEMTRIRSTLTQGRVLSEIAKKYQFGPYVRASIIGQKQGVYTSARIGEDVVEALIGAVYKDGGVEAARAVLLRLYGNLDRWLKQGTFGDNPKGELQELVQGKEGGAEILEYKLVGQEGPPHDRRFAVEVFIRGKCMGKGVGKSRKEADQNAAREALDQLIQLRAKGEDIFQP